MADNADEIPLFHPQGYILHGGLFKRRARRIDVGQPFRLKDGRPFILHPNGRGQNGGRRPLHGKQRDGLGAFLGGEDALGQRKPLSAQDMAQLGRLGHVKLHCAQPVHLGEDLTGRPVEDTAAFVHHHHAIGLYRLVHVMGNQDNRDAALPVKAVDGIKHLAASLRIKHGGRLVENDAFRLHGDDPGDGDALFLAAGQLMRRVLTVFQHPNSLQGGVHPAADFRGRDAEVFRAEGHILFNNGGHQLVIRVLQHHAHRPAHLVFVRFIGGVHLLD